MRGIKVRRANQTRQTRRGRGGGGATGMEGVDWWRGEDYRQMGNENYERASMKEVCLGLGAGRK